MVTVLISTLFFGSEAVKYKRGDKMSEIYADIYFLINFSMDFICLFLTGIILGKRIRIPRIILGAAIGGVYSLLNLCLDFADPFRVIITVFAAFIMCFSSFGGTGAYKEIIFPTFLYISVSFFMGGALTYLYSALGKYFAPSSQDFSILLIPASLICGFLSYIISKKAKKRLSAKKFEIEIVTSKKHKFSAFCDSGNLLREPVGGFPVIILSKKASLNYITCGIFTPEEALKYPEVSEKIRIIPAKSAFSGGILVGFIPKGGVNIENRNLSCCVAFSENADFDGCDCLVPAILLK